MKKFYESINKSFIVISFFIFTHTTELTYPQMLNDSLIAVKFKGDAKIEVGSPFIGMEFHHSFPIPQRISFYYPVANSIDLSTDYWKRDATFISSLNLKINNDVFHEIGKEPFLLKMTPYYASFTKKSSMYQIKISYDFSRNKSAAIVTYAITNTSNQTNNYEFDAKYYLTLRTCHTYNFIDEIIPMISKDKSEVYVDYANKEVGGAQIFFVNAGIKAYELDLSSDTNRIHIDKRKVKKPFIKYSFKKKLVPQEKMVIVQIIGSVKKGEGLLTAGYMKRNYQKEIDDYSSFILNKSVKEERIKLYDPYLDHSVLWAKAILAVNSHYIDGSFEPMPCPAEYNFFFTHDVLLTDLAAVNFDLKRVRSDLSFIISHADKNNGIPHAYYWKDSTYKTEYAGTDNWNNYWFVIVAAKYLMHSADTSFLKQLIPFIVKSMEIALSKKNKDDLIESNRPDWWDIGKRYGPRSYMTILAIKTLRSFNYISTILKINLDQLLINEELSNRMQESLNKNLWQDDVDYLMNFYSDGKRDEHFYMGSLLAAHFNLLKEDHIDKMIRTVQSKLFDKNVGVYSVWPMDFNKLIDFWNFSGNEAGEPYYYINGGIWPHANAWYAIALSMLHRKNEAAGFIKKTMTVKGIMDGPNGQPAMFEVRNGNSQDPTVYGTVDKPQFLWAAGWYLYSLYNIYLEKENDWNLQLDPFLIDDQNLAQFTFSYKSNEVQIEINRKQKSNFNISYDRKNIPSLVLPQNVTHLKKIDLNIRETAQPFLVSTSSILTKVNYSDKVMILQLKAFIGHQNMSVIHSMEKPNSIIVNGNKLETYDTQKKGKGFDITFAFRHKTNSNELIKIIF